MSVIIKGMEMPKNCMECDLHFTARGLDEECIFSNDTVEDCTERRLYRCPLVEIPTPHGRLIDADKLQTAIHGCLCENCQTFPCEKGIGCLIEDVFNLLDEAPTIIEAEVE